MTFRRSSLAALLVAALPIVAAAQQPWQLARTTGLTVAMDTSVVTASDSIHQTRGITIGQLRKLIGVRAFDSLLTTKLNLTGATITGSPTWSSTFTAATGQRVDSSTGAARSQKLTTARTIGGTSFDGTANITVGLSDSSTGSARAQILTTSRNLWGLAFNGSANVTGKPAFASAWSSTGRDSLLAGSALAFAANDTVYGQPVWNAAQTFATGQLVDSATGAARSQKLTTARTLWGVSFDGTANATTAPTFGAGATVSNGQTLALGTATISGTPTWSSRQTFATGQVVDTAVKVRGLLVDTATLAKNLTGSPAITVSSCTGCGGTPQDSIRLKNGAAATPSLMFANSLTTGLYRFGADTIGVATLGRLAVRVVDSSAQVQFGRVDKPGLAFIGDSTTGIYRSSAQTLAITTGGARRFSCNSTSCNATVPYLSGNTGSAGAPEFGISSPATGLFFSATADTIFTTTSGVQAIGIRGGASSTIFGGAGDMTIQGGIGNSRRLAINTTTSAGAATLAARFNEKQQTLFANGSSSFPSMTFASDTITGFAKNGTDTIGVMTAGANTLYIMGGSSGVIAGSSNLSIKASGDGAASARMVLQTNTSGGVATTFLRGNEVQQTLLTNSTVRPALAFVADSNTGINLAGGNVGQLGLWSRGQLVATVDTATSSSLKQGFNMQNGATITISNGTAAAPALYFTGRADGIYGTSSGDTIAVTSAGVSQMKISSSGGLKLPVLPAEGSTKNAVCWDGTTFAVTQNAAATCTVSSARFKKNISVVPIGTTTRIIANLHASQYEEREGGRRAFGVIAEQADSADSRLASRDAKGLVTSTNYEEITSLLVDKVNEQQLEISSLSKQVADLMASVAKLAKGKPSDVDSSARNHTLSPRKP